MKNSQNNRFTTAGAFKSPAVMIKVVLLLSAFFFFSCEKTPTRIKYEAGEILNIGKNDFPVEVRLTGKKFQLPVMFPREVLALEEYLIVSEKKADTLIHIFEKVTLKPIRKVGINGFGPGEVNTIDGLWANPNHAGSFWVLQRQNKLISLFNVSSESLHSDYSFKQEGNLFLAIDLVWATDSTLMGTQANGNEKFLEYNLEGEVLNTYDTWDHMAPMEDMPINTVISLNQGRLRASPDRKKFVLAFLDRDILEILDKASGQVLSIRGPIQHVPKFKIDYSAGYPMLALNFETVVYCYVHVFAGEKLVYGLFSGRSFQEVDKEKVKFCERIFVFDYEGNIVGNYLLDHTISEFTVDEKKKKIYGITFDDEPNIVEFDLIK